MLECLYKLDLGQLGWKEGLESAFSEHCTKVGEKHLDILKSGSRPRERYKGFLAGLGGHSRNVQ